MLKEIITKWLGTDAKNPRDNFIETLTSYGKSQYDKGVEETRKSIREEIGGKKVKVNGVVIEQDMKNLGYNQALDEILSLKSLE